MKKTIEKERLINSALAMYSKYGIKSITMDSLSRELGISKKTIYRYVKDKYELVKLVLLYERDVQQAYFSKMRNSEMNAIDELIHVNKHIHHSQSIHSPTFYYDLKTYFHEIHREWIEYKRKRMYELIYRNLKKGIEEGYFRDNLDPDLISKLHMARVEMMHSSEILEEDEVSNAQFINEIFVYHIHGICNEKGLSYFNEQLKNKENQI